MPACEASPRGCVEIGLPASRVLRRRFAPLIGRDEARSHFVTDLERFRSDRGSEPGHELARRAFQRRERRLDHAVGEAAPAGMRDADTRARAIAEKHGQTVRRQDGAYLRRIEGDRAVSDGCDGDSAGRATVVPCSCWSQTGSESSASALRSRRRFSATRAA